ncbi:ferritin-like domain-containing protein [Bradyrhizobium sp.]|uniref:ferritin-like domain-containing protein n=1 Tax=Bradyrhizobium sp. TaxID=376 RepID=UPI0025C53E0C|nr:ferritin-like domain-containing protein [Bradyrhizobium sp.]
MPFAAAVRAKKNNDPSTHSRNFGATQLTHGDTMPHPAEAKEKEAKFTRKQLIEALNEDLSREYQAIITYVNYSQVLKGAAYMNIADELAVHAGEELQHALKVASHIDYLGGMPSVTPKPVKTSEKAEDMLRFDLDNEKETIRHYRRRVRQADALNEYAIAESLRGILVDEQDHLIALATALGIDAPDPGIAD